MRLARWLGLRPWLVPQLLAILFMDRVNSAPMQLAAADFRTGWGNSPAVTSTSGIFFTVSNGDSTAICDLSFDTNLRKIDYAEVSCEIMFSFTPGSSWFGLTDHSWSFYTDIDGEIYDIFATISFNPKTNMLFDLRLCFSSTCAQTSSAVGMTTTPTTTACDCGTTETMTGTTGFAATQGATGSINFMRMEIVQEEERKIATNRALGEFCLNYRYVSSSSVRQVRRVQAQ